ncbi:hypothetical protein LCGC14_2461130, partial [marine sediment metagenome]
VLLTGGCFSFNRIKFLKIGISELRDSFNNPTTKYQLSEEYLEKQPINMPKSESL